MIKLMAIGSKRRLQVEYRPKVFLHCANPLADRNLATEFRFQMLSCRKMIGMRMSFKYPCQLKIVLLDMRTYLVGLPCVGPSRYNGKAEYRIDNRCRFRLRITDNVSQGTGLLIVEMMYVRLHRPDRCCWK